MALWLVSCGGDVASGETDGSGGGGGGGAATKGGGGQPAAGGVAGNAAGNEGGGGAASTGGSAGDPLPSGKPIFVAVGYGGHRTRSLDGKHWQDHVIDDPNGGDDKTLLRGVSFADGVFVAVGERVLTSTDGAQWKKAAYTPASFLNQACALNGLWVAAGGNGLRVRSSDKAVTWEVSVSYMDGHFRGLACGKGRFVAVGQRNSTGMMSFSTDGMQWSEPSLGGAKLGRVAFGNGVFVAVGDAGRVATSSDGQAWSNSTLGTANRDMIMFSNGLFVTTEDGGFQTSPDGKTWTRVKSTGSFTAFAGAPGVWVGVLYPGKMHHGADLAKLTLGESTAPDFIQIAVGFLP
ncbi:MAG: hypothetical protein SF187_13510 [Deltaproteobacteria bacterium]|nr:hypothetical protein [Deltaproteobacteria bacterium]